MPKATACPSFFRAHPMQPPLQSMAAPSFMHRRDLLRTTGLSLFGLTLPELLRGQAAAAPLSGRSFGKAKACILLFMWGGPAHQDTFDMKPLAPPEIRGEFKPIATNLPGTQICEYLPQLATRMDRLAVVRSMTHDNVDHLPSTHYLLTGQPPLPGKTKNTDWPHIGAVLSKLGRGKEPLPPFVSMRPKIENTVPRFVEQSRGQFAGWLGETWDPLTIDANPAMPGYKVGDFALQAGISNDRLEERRSLLAELEFGGSDARRRRIEQTSTIAATDAHYRRAFDLLASRAGDAAFDLTKEPQKVRERYGLNAHGQSVLQARRLIERGVPLVTVFWPNEGIMNVSVYWDTHSRNFVDLKERLLPPADQAFCALLDDLRERGLFDETLVVWTGEFGRTPKIGQRNSDAGAGRDGRDHWPGCFTSILAGGGVQGGVVFGASDKQAAYPTRDPVRPVDLVATVYHCLGVPEGLEMMDNENRPHVICPGKKLNALLV